MTIEQKAKAFDDLNEKISRFYDPEDELYESGDLCQIGEVAASFMGFL